MSDFRVFEYEVNTAKLPAGAAGPVFVMLADLHNFSYGPGNERLAEAVLAQKPDAVLVAGDLLVGRPGADFTPALELMRRLREAELPVYYGNGNPIPTSDNSVSGNPEDYSRYEGKNYG